MAWYLHLIPPSCYYHCCVVAQDLMDLNCYAIPLEKKDKLYLVNSSKWMDFSSFGFDFFNFANYLTPSISYHPESKAQYPILPSLSNLVLYGLEYSQCMHQFADLKGATSAGDSYFCLLQSTILPTYDTCKWI